MVEKVVQDSVFSQSNHSIKNIVQSNSISIRRDGDCHKSSSFPLFSPTPTKNSKTLVTAFLLLLHGLIDDTKQRNMIFTTIHSILLVFIGIWFFPFMGMANAEDAIYFLVRKHHWFWLLHHPYR